MTPCLHASFYADQAIQRTVPMVEQVLLARDTYRLRFRCPEMARAILPGQFLMIRLAGCNDPLLGRPLALYDTIPGPDGQPRDIDVVYLAKGKLTTRLATATAGCLLDVWGPLGNGFTPRPTQHLLMVAGGIGQTPFLAVAQEQLGKRTYGDRTDGNRTHGNPTGTGAHAGHVTLCYGARSADRFAGLDDFRQAGVELRLATDDGTLGHHGLVTDLLETELKRLSAAPSQRESAKTFPASADANAEGTFQPSRTELMTDEQPARCRVLCCGPEPMMEAVAGIAARCDIPCEVSLETPMACGIGICFTCVAKIRDDAGGWDYKRTCVEGPVFPADRIVW